jgi:hypothetical protein
MLSSIKFHWFSLQFFHPKHICFPFLPDIILAYLSQLDGEDNRSDPCLRKRRLLLSAQG